MEVLAVFEDSVIFSTINIFTSIIKPDLSGNGHTKTQYFNRRQYIFGLYNIKYELIAQKIQVSRHLDILSWTTVVLVIVYVLDLVVQNV